MISCQAALGKKDRVGGFLESTICAGHAGMREKYCFTAPAGSNTAPVPCCMMNCASYMPDIEPCRMRRSRARISGLVIPAQNGVIKGHCWETSPRPQSTLPLPSSHLVSPLCSDSGRRHDMEDEMTQSGAIHPPWPTGRMVSLFDADLVLRIVNLLWKAAFWHAFFWVFCFLVLGFFLSYS